MKVLGISFGRRIGNCELTLKKALMEAEKAGAEVSMIRTMPLEIGHCIGCGACSGGMRAGKQIKCVLKDDYLFLENAVLDADAIIVSAPVYVLGPTGQFKNFVDRFGAAHDRMAVLAEEKKRQENGQEPIDPRVLADKYVAFISVGGATTPHWVSLGVPSMQLFAMSTHMKVVDQIDAYGMGGRTNPLFDEEFMERCGQLGRNLAAETGKPYNQVKWYGDTPGTCPSCHCDLLTFRGNNKVECPICGIEGDLKVDNGEVKVEFSAKELARSRYELAGLQEHYEEISGFGKIGGPRMKERGEELKAKLEAYKAFDEGHIVTK